MKSSLLAIVLFLTSAILWSAGSLAKGKAKKMYAEENSVHRQKIVGILFANTNLSLVKADGTSFVGCQDPTLGDYLAVLFANGGFSDTESQRKMSLKCADYNQEIHRPLPERSDNGDYRFCSLEAAVLVKSAKKPWGHSLLFAIERKTGALAKDRFACPGLRE